MVPECSSSRVTWMSFRGERPHGERRPRPGSLLSPRGAGALCPRRRARIGERRRPVQAGIDKIAGGRSGCQRKAVQGPSTGRVVARGLGCHAERGDGAGQVLPHAAALLPAGGRHAQHRRPATRPRLHARPLAALPPQHRRTQSPLRRVVGRLDPQSASSTLASWPSSARLGDSTAGASTAPALAAQTCPALAGSTRRSAQGACASAVQERSAGAGRCVGGRPQGRATPSNSGTTFRADGCQKYVQSTRRILFRLTKL
jgi:hypothetical protein